MAPKKPPPRELRFVPVTKRLYFFVNGQAVHAVEAWGGPDRIVADTQGGMAARPTTAGSYLIHSVGPYVTKTWVWSKIRWGAPLRVTGSEVEQETSPGRWVATTKVDPWLTKARIEAMHLGLYGTARVPDRWLFNDFGPIAIRYFKDADHDGRKDDDEPLSGEMFHTTAENEAEHARGLPLRMAESHGCIHLKPLDRDELMRMGAFTPGTPLTIHSYEMRVVFRIQGAPPP